MEIRVSDEGQENSFSHAQSREGVSGFRHFSRQVSSTNDTQSVSTRLRSNRLLKLPAQ